MRSQAAKAVTMPKAVNLPEYVVLPASAWGPKSVAGARRMFCSLKVRVVSGVMPDNERPGCACAKGGLRTLYCRMSASEHGHTRLE